MTTQQFTFRDVPGPWQNEPDREEFKHAGLPCIVNRQIERGMGFLCGYAGVPPGHPLHRVDYDDAYRRFPDLEVHGGLTYARPCQGVICHVPAPGESDDIWWFGFDCAHSGDFMPGMDALALASGDKTWIELRSDRLGEKYRDLAYVKAETCRLAEQLASLIVERTSG